MYSFALTVSTWTVLRQYYPDVMSRVATRGAVFARMSPDHKQQLVQELQGLDYFVGKLEKIHSEGEPRADENSRTLPTLNSSECDQTRGCRSFDRKCMRCELYNLEVQADESYPGKNMFTKSFSPTDSFEDIFSSRVPECDGETRVLFSKSLNITSDEDDDRKGIKRTYEDTRDSKYFDPHKKPRKAEIQEIGPKSRRTSNFSLRSLRAAKSPSSVLSGASSISSRRSKPKYIRSSTPKSDVSTKTQSDGPIRSYQSSSETKQLKKYKKTQEKENLCKGRNDKVAVYEKTTITMTACENYIMGKSEKRLREYSEPQHAKNDSQDSTNALKDVTRNLVPVKNRSERTSQVRIPVLERFLEGLREQSVPAPQSGVEIKVLPAIEEKTESQSSRSCRSKNSDSYSFTESYTSSGSGSFDYDHKPISSTVKANFSGVRFKRKARLVIEKPGASKMFPNSCLKKKSKSASWNSAPSKSTSLKRIEKKSVKFLIDGDDNDGTGGDLVPKRSARLEKFPDQLKVLKPSKKRKSSSGYVAAPVILSIHETISTDLRNKRQDEIMNVVVKGQNVPEQLVNDLGFLRNLHAYGRNMYAMLQPQTPVVQGPPAVTITELRQDEPIRRRQLTTSGTHKTSRTTDHDKREIVHACSSDMVMENIKNSVNDDIISKKAISAGPVNVNTSRPRKQQQQDSLEDMKKHIRMKLGNQNKSTKAVEDNGKIDDLCKETDLMVRSPSRIVTTEQLPNKGSPISLRGKKGSSASEHANKKGMPQAEDVSTKGRPKTSKYSSPSCHTYTVHSCVEEEPVNNQRGRARSPTIRNAQRASIRNNSNALRGRMVSTSTSSPAEGSHPPESAYVSVESNGGESNHDARTGRRLSLSPQRPPSRRPHLSPTSRRAVSANADLNQKSPGPPRTLLTMQMQGKPDPNTASTLRQHLGSEIPNTNSQVLVKRSIKATGTYASDKIGSLKTTKSPGHPLRNRNLEEFIQDRVCMSYERDARLVKRKTR